MVKFESFFRVLPNHATDALNEWIDNHPKAKIIDFQFQQARYGDHSICIRYEEEDGE